MMFFLVGKFVQGLRKKFQDELAAASTTAEESIGNIRTVRSFSQERKAMNNYEVDIDKSYNVGAKLAVASGNNNNCNNMALAPTLFKWITVLSQVGGLNFVL